MKHKTKQKYFCKSSIPIYKLKGESCDATIGLKLTLALVTFHRIQNKMHASKLEPSLHGLPVILLCFTSVDDIVRALQYYGL